MIDHVVGRIDVIIGMDAIDSLQGVSVGGVVVSWCCGGIRNVIRSRAL